MTAPALPATPVESSFGNGRRPEESTHVRSDYFDGPLALLLSLIEQRQLDVLTVRLGDLAGAYLEALARIETGRLGLLSSFVTVCSQLILIKSRALLPRAPQIGVDGSGQVEADPEEELRKRLIEYRMFRDAGRVLGDRRATGAWLYHREAAAALAAGLSGARPDPGPPLAPQLLADALLNSVKLVPPAPTPPEVIRAALRRAPLVVLQELLRGITDRVVVAVTFLAVLELAKGRELVVEQAEPWGSITITPLAASQQDTDD
jgi:segregation and condensation protein A